MQGAAVAALICARLASQNPKASQSFCQADPLLMPSAKGPFVATATSQSAEGNQVGDSAEAKTCCGEVQLSRDEEVLYYCLSPPENYGS